MNREYHRWWSPSLHHDMELLLFGHAGMPILVFPSSMGRFFEFEDAGMVGAIADRINGGHVQIFCVDSIDKESWYNKHAHPRDRVRRHMDYEQYVLNEVVPLIHARAGGGGLCVTGASFGAYHAMNFALRHPEIVTHLVAMSGAYDIHQFLDGYYDDNCYFNNPVDFLPNMADEWYLARYRAMRIVLGSSDWDICQNDNWRMAGIMHSKGIPHWLDIWQGGHKHDWPLWRLMAQKYFS